MLKHCATEDDYRRALEESKEGSVFFLKHSVTCGVSSGSRREFRKFAEEEEEVSCWEMVVQEKRELSGLIAEETGVRHESPQAFLFRDGTVVWSASHWEITRENLRAALSTG